MKPLHLAEETLWAVAADEPVDAAAMAHLDTCGSCRVRLASIRQTRVLVRRARPPDPSPGAQRAALERFEHALLEENRRRWTWWERRPLILPAFGLSALAGAALALLLSSGGPPASEWYPPELASQDLQPAPPAVPDLAPPGTPSSVEPPPAPVMAAVPARRQGGSSLVRPRPRSTSPSPVAPQLAVVPPPAVVPEPVEEAVFTVEQVARFPRVVEAREALARGNHLEAARLAAAVLVDGNQEENALVVEVMRDACLGHATAEMLPLLDDVMSRDQGQREALAYLACEVAVLSKRGADAVQRCRSFAREFPMSPRARDASYVAGTLSRDELRDCAGAIDDYSNALVFTGPLLGSLNDDALFWRATCYAELGREADAKADLERFLSRYPSRRVDPRVRALAERLATR